jgi:hypothetical protein
VPHDIPDAALVRVVANAGPYRAGDLLTFAFSEPSVARILPHHDGVSGTRRSSVPELMPVVVLRASASFASGDELIVSFVDAELARLYALPPRSRVGEPEASSSAIQSLARETEPAPTELSRRPRRLETIGEWDEPRRRHALAFVDKLFSVENLGWYRHTFATRFLMANGLAGEEHSIAPLAAAFASFRHAVSETLGETLIASYLPGFAIDESWAERLDSPSARQAREDLTVAWPRDADIDLGGSVDATVAALIACDTEDARLARALGDYRADAFEAFERVASAIPEVRFETMMQTNLHLDDRLWSIAGALYESLQTSAA